MFIQPNNIADVSGEYSAQTIALQKLPMEHYSTLLVVGYLPRCSSSFIHLCRKIGLQVLSIQCFVSTKPMVTYPRQLWGSETYTMIGNHAIPVIVDAYLKGIKGFDYQEAYKAVKGSSINAHRNAPYDVLDKYGYFPEDIQSQSVSITLEIAYNDWCVAQMAKSFDTMKIVTLQ